MVELWLPLGGGGGYCHP